MIDRGTAYKIFHSNGNISYFGTEQATSKTMFDVFGRAVTTHELSHLILPAATATMEIGMLPSSFMGKNLYLMIILTIK